MAILLRSVRSYAGPYVDALGAAGLPHVVIGDGRLLNRDDVAQLRDLLNFLSASKPWGDRFLRHPVVGLNAKTCRALKGIKEDVRNLAADGALQAAGVEEAADRRRLLALLALKQRVQEGRYDSLMEVFYGLLAASGYFARCEREGRLEALQNLEVLCKLVAAFDEYGRTRNFYSFMAYLKLMREGGVDPIPAMPEDAVQVMTIHQAKGLEFPVWTSASFSTWPPPAPTTCSSSGQPTW